MKEKLIAYLPFLLIGVCFFVGGVYLVASMGFSGAAFIILLIGLIIFIAIWQIAKAEIKWEEDTKKLMKKYNIK